MIDKASVPPFPRFLGLIDGLMVSTGEIGSWLLYLDKILDPSPSLFAVIARAAWTLWVGKKGKVKAKSKGSASIHLTERFNGNKWLSFDRPCIHPFSVTSAKDTEIYLCCSDKADLWLTKRKINTLLLLHFSFVSMGSQPSTPTNSSNNNVVTWQQQLIWKHLISISGFYFYIWIVRNRRLLWILTTIKRV